MAELLPAAGSRPARIAQLPAGDVRLSDGRLLRRLHRFAAGAAYSERKPDGLRVIATMDASHAHGTLLHVSVSYPDHDPSWRDLVAIKTAFFGTDIDAMMVLPRVADYINIHEHCFHVWQTPVTWGVQ